MLISYLDLDSANASVSMRMVLWICPSSSECRHASLGIVTMREKSSVVRIREVSPSNKHEESWNSSIAMEIDELIEFRIPARYARAEGMTST